MNCEDLFTEKCRELKYSHEEIVTQRKLIADEYAKMKNKTFSIFALLANNQIELKPIKRVFYKSKFIWPTIFGLCGIIVTLFNAFTRPYAALYFGPVEVQMYEATLFSALLLITSYPVTIRSFNQHMERHPQDGLGKNLVRFLRLFLLPALIFIGYLLYRNHLLG